MQFRTGESEAQLLYMRELTGGHHISLYLSDGALHLQVNPDTSIGPLTDHARLDDQEWHKVVLELDDGLLRASDKFSRNKKLCSGLHRQVQRMNEGGCQGL